MRQLLILLIVVSTAGAQEPLGRRDIPYAEPPHERQTLDVYAPKEGKNHPIVFWIHGGGWQRGDKTEVKAKPQAFVERGFVFVSTNYRFVPHVTIKQMAGDIARSIRWVHDHAVEFGGDPQTIFVLGHSAGAQLAALVCTDDRYLKAEGLSLSILRGCVPVDGDTYDVPMQIATVEPRRKEAYRFKFGDEAAQIDLSPVTHVARDKGIPPVLSLHVAGHPETTAQSQRLVQALRDAGVPARAYAAQGKDHATLNDDLGTPGDEATREVFAFLDGLLAGAERRPTATLRIDQASAEQIGAAWRPLFRGVEALSLESRSPRLVQGQALRIDTQAPGLSFFVHPSNGDRPLECDSITTSRFLAQYRLQAAINAAPFHPVVDEEGVPQDVIGLVISQGERVSEPAEGYGALLISSKNECRIVEQPPESLEDVVLACGGFRRILVDGQNIAPDDALHPRSAVGVNREGRYLILLVLDGRQRGHSEGATQRETAEILHKLGAWSGLNLDGGGSSSLVVEGTDGRPLILNRPIHKGMPGKERPCPNHLGVFAQPLGPDRGASPE